MPFPTADVPFDQDPANPKSPGQAGGQNQSQTTTPTKPGFRPILVLDFDGVIHSYTSGWQGPAIVSDPPVPGLFEFLEEATVHFQVAVFSSRSHHPEGMNAMREWLWKHCVAYLVNMEHMQTEEARPLASSLVYAQIDWPLYKPSAMITIDDRAITFDGTWPNIMDLVTFKPWNKRAPKSTPQEAKPEATPVEGGDTQETHEAT